MTAVQEQKLKEVVETLGEHFSAAVLVVQAVSEDEKKSDYQARWTQGLPSALGMLTIGHQLCVRTLNNP